MILDFRLPIISSEQRLPKLFLNSVSDNRKSKCQTRKWLGLSVIASVLAMCGAVALAQQSVKIPKIGFLGSGPSSRPWHESFKREFRKLGYVDGKNVTFIHGFADTKYDRLPVLADELVRLKVDVIITPGSMTGALQGRY